MSKSSQEVLNGTESEKGFQVGFRPIDVRLVAASDPQAVVQGAVRDLDTLGQSTIVTITLDSLLLKAKVNVRKAPDRGENVGITVDTEKLYFFEAHTGKRLS